MMAQSTDLKGASEALRSSSLQFLTSVKEFAVVILTITVQTFREMKANKDKIKANAILAFQVLAIFAGCAVFLFGLWDFMWACYYAGIPM